MIRQFLIVGVVATVGLAVAYLTDSSDIGDLKLVSVEGFHAQDVGHLKGLVTPETPVFQVRFSTASDLVSYANQLDAYSFSGRVLVGDAGCNPDLDQFTYTNVAEMLIDLARLYDETGDIQGRSLWSSDAQGEPNVYHFFFAVLAGRFDEFIYLGLDEAALCFEVTGTSRTGRTLYSNIVPLPRDILAKAAEPLNP